jgi:hypothetical protein
LRNDTLKNKLLKHFKQIPKDLIVKNCEPKGTRINFKKIKRQMAQDSDVKIEMQIAS